MATHEELKNLLSSQKEIQKEIMHRADCRYDDYKRLKEAITDLMNGCGESNVDFILIHWSVGMHHVHTHVFKSLIFTGNHYEGYKVRVNPK